MAVLFVVAALLFWDNNPVRDFLSRPAGDSDQAKTEDGLESSPSGGTQPGSAGEGGGFKDGRGALASTPPPRAPVVAAGALDDGILRLLVLGDEQALDTGEAGGDGWPQHAARLLEQRLRVARPGWRELRVEAEVRAEPGWTAEEAFEVARTEIWTRAASERPELLVVALGWHDGSPPPSDRPKAAIPPNRRRAWLEEISQVSVVPGHRESFYLRVPAEGQTPHPPLRHLELLDALGATGARESAAVYYLEQPVFQPGIGRRVHPSTGLRPQPWVATVFALEHEAKPEALFGAGEPLRLSPLGAEVLGTLVGKGLVQAVLAAKP